MKTCQLGTGWGRVTLELREDGRIRRIELPRGGSGAGVGERPPAHLREFCEALQAYFGGERVSFLPYRDLLAFDEASAFSQGVWALLLEVPYGAVTSYGLLARALGRPGAARAVGRAVGANPWPVVVPCHRVVAGDGRLTGYGGGIEWKQRLLALERVPFAGTGARARVQVPLWIPSGQEAWVGSVGR